MKELTNAEFAILSLLVEQSCHGYEIEQVIEVRGMREWTEVGFSSIYYLLRKMAAEGLIEGRSEKSRGRGPARKVFRVTEEGVDAWRAATISALAEPQPCYPRIQLGLSNLPALPQAEVLAALRKYRFNLEERLGHVRLRREQQRPLPDQVEAMFDYSLHMLEAEREWISAFIRLKEQAHDKD